MGVKKIKINNLPEVPSICNQRLKEAWKSSKASIAYVEMDAGNVSLLHKHGSFKELYYVLDGAGVLQVGNEKVSVEKDTLVEIKPGIAHKLENTGKSVLRHLVVCFPPFKSNDVKILNE